MISAQEATAIDTLWCGAWYERQFTVWEVFPDPHLPEDVEGREALRNLRRKGLLAGVPHRRGVYRCDLDVLRAAYSAWSEHV